MSLCSEYGIPHSEFLSWDAEDRVKALAFALEKGERCTLCGTAPWEWEENKFAYTPQDHYCHGCYLKTVATEGQGRLPGTTVELTKLTPAEKARRAIRERELRQRRMADEDGDGGADS